MTRTVRKPTRWTPEEWARIEEKARARGVPPLRYVREAALGEPPAPRRHALDELTRQLGPVLSNLRQLHRVAEDDWVGDDGAAARIGQTIAATEAAIRAAPAPHTTAAEAVHVVLVAGRALASKNPASRPLHRHLPLARSRASGRLLARWEPVDPHLLTSVSSTETEAPAEALCRGFFLSS